MQLSDFLEGLITCKEIYEACWVFSLLSLFCFCLLIEIRSDQPEHIFPI